MQVSRQQDSIDVVEGNSQSESSPTPISNWPDLNSPAPMEEMEDQNPTKLVGDHGI
jgi:hypothetical protein